MTPDSPVLLPLPFDRLVHGLRKQGFYIGLDTLARLQRYWQDIVQQPGFDAARLKAQLTALLCQSAEEQDKCYAALDAYWPVASEPISWSESPPPPAPQPATPLPDPEPFVSPLPSTESPPAPSPKLIETPAALSGPILPPLTFPSDLPRVWNLPELGPALLPLLEKEWADTVEWDVPQTIRQTIHAGGIPSPAFRRRKRAPRYLILVEQQSPRDHLAGFGVELARELGRRDLEVDFYFFKNTPARCWKNLHQPRSHVYVEYLRSEWEEARLLLIGSAGALFDPLTHDVSNLARDLVDWWPRATLLCTTPTPAWGPTEQALQALLPVVPLHPRGLRTLMAQWNGTQSFAPAFWQGILPEPIPPALTPNRAHTRDDVVVDLYRYLGEEAFRWLCATAIYPEIYYELTAIFHDEAIPPRETGLSEWEQNAIWHRALLHLSRLDWFRQGYLPEAMRLDLRQRLKNDELALIETELRRILNWSANAVHDENSYAAVEREEIFGWLLERQGGDSPTPKTADQPPLQQQTNVPYQTESRESWLARGDQAFKAVCKVVRADGEMATGFLAADHYLFTVSYLLNNPEEARDARAEFNYELDPSGHQKSIVSYRLDASDFVFSDKTELCFTRVKIIDQPDNPLSQWGALDFEPENVPAEGESLQIVHHPEGKEKKNILDDCAVVARWNQFLFYSPVTRPGSGGAPVFNRDWKVVAIHRARKDAVGGGMQINDAGDRRAASQGVLTRDIAGFIAGGKGRVETAAFRALWIDDRPEKVTDEQTALRREFDLAFYHARNLDEAFRWLARDAHIRFVVSDIGREEEPDAGFGTLRALRERGVERPVLFYTNERGMNLRESLMGAGAYLVTANPEELRQAVGQILHPPEAADAPPPEAEAPPRMEEAPAKAEYEAPAAEQVQSETPYERVVDTSKGVNALDAYLDAIQSLIFEGELDIALKAALELDRTTGAGLANDLTILAGTFNQMKRTQQQELTDNREYEITAARTRAGLLELLKDFPRRIALNARTGGAGSDALQFTVPPAETITKLLGRFDNRFDGRYHMDWIQDARRAAAAVCQIVLVNEVRGMGFLTRDGYLFTTHQALPSSYAARDVRLEFGTPGRRIAYESDHDDFISDEELDFTRLRIKDRTDAPLSNWGFVVIDPGAPPPIGDPVIGVQAPVGTLDPVRVDAGTILGAENQNIFCDLNMGVGSTGAPIFSRDWKVVALHAPLSYDTKIPNAEGEYRIRSRGILFREIFDFIDDQEQNDRFSKRPRMKK